MTMTIDELIASGVRQANDILVGKPGAELLPTFVIQFKDRPSTMVATPWLNDREKFIATEAMRLMLKLHRANVDSYMFWSEAWQAYEDSKHPIGLMPCDREDRKEVVIINAFNHASGKMIALEIMRDDKGVVTSLVNNDKEDDITALSGLLHNLLQDE
jgi:hypothetical protein